MKNIFLIVSSIMLLQACGATTPEPSVQTSAQASKSKLERFSRPSSTTDIKQKRENEYQQKLAELETKSAANDVQQAIARNQIHLLSYYGGRSTVAKVPGLSAQQLNTVRCPLKQIDGMGDVIYGRSHKMYRKALLRYATDFNLRMVSHCK
ncbi:MAG: hypothetical protein V3U71_11185 [Cocleimonas sp.]